MYDPLGLSIGTMNLVAAANGGSPVIRRAVLTLYPHCAPKLVASEATSDATQLGVPMTGFVERIGDSVALISPDGAAHDPDLLTVEALDAMVAAIGADSSSAEIAIAIPAHWKPATVQSLRDALRTHVGFVRSGMAPRLVPDAIAALTAVRSEAEVPSAGVVGLLDFGGSGTNVTLLEIKDEVEPISATMRYEEFSGNQIDHELLLHAIDTLGEKDADPSSTAAVGQLNRLRVECREAKERLSVDAVTELAVELSGTSTVMQLSRDKFEDLISDRLTGFIYAFDDMLARNHSCFADLAALVTVGGGASIPLVSQRLSVHTRLPILTASQPMCAAAQGALLAAARGELLDLRTRASIGLMAKTAAGIDVLDPPSSDLLVIDHDALTDRELAWSQTEFPEVPTRFEADPYHEDGACFSMRLNLIDPPKEPPWRRFRVSQVLIGLCAAVAMTAIGGVAITLTAIEQRHTPTKAPTPPSVAPSASLPGAALPTAVPPTAVPPSPIEPSPLPPPSEVPSVVAPTTVEPPPPPPPPPSPTQRMTTTRPAPPVTTTSPPAATTPLTTPPPPSTESPTPTETSNAAEAPSTSEPSSVRMTTQWLHVPLIPVPIPIQVPANQAPANQYPQNQYPQNQYPQTQDGPQNPFAGVGSP
ncbi:Hsp70 family protein [Mycobacterium vicinigordonae]|uniref:Hsp70 family protein n=1 Tax=Mycobacterium vicinigordonae TaxID=1719132 RepID=A0A7D6IW11_9MYCO|nr:Hsp70 family protein [Mycobacterium vicinigordonae]QLL09959.1 Hsp70 family protein [Mycobacterium vicinigordonae]